MKSRSLSFLIGCWLFLCSFNLYGQNPWPETLPADTEISLLTASPGYRVHNVFGHSALRVRSNAQGVDEVFNWGTFDYKVDYFVPKFILGTLPYTLSHSRYKYFEESYISQNRTISELVLEFTPAQKQKLNALLVENLKKENRSYRYDFFFDNCSTRIRDLIEETYGAELSGEESEQAVSFKYLLQDYLERDSWMQLGVNLILGRRAADNVDFRSAMFLPKYLEDNLRKATANGVAVKKSESLIHQGVNSRKASLIPPIIPFGILLIIGIWACFKKPKAGGSMRFLDKLFFSFVGLAGWLFVFMWLGTEHIATHQNIHTFWAIPFFLPLVWFLKGKKLHYFLFGALVFMFVILVQDFATDLRLYAVHSPSILAIIALVLVRILYNLKASKPA